MGGFNRGWASAFLGWEAEMLHPDVQSGCFPVHLMLKLQRWESAVLNVIFQVQVCGLQDSVGVGQNNP